jgi:hypothetical protein
MQNPFRYDFFSGEWIYYTKSVGFVNKKRILVEFNGKKLNAEGKNSDCAVRGLPQNRKSACFLRV